MRNIRPFVTVWVLAASCLTTTGHFGRAFAAPLGTAITFQGELRDAGAYPTGPYDMRFRLYDTPTGGFPIGSILCGENIMVADGRFTVQLDFGAVFTGQDRYLQIDVRADTGLDSCANVTGYVILTPRLRLTNAPNAVYSMSAGNASALNGQDAAFYTNAANLSSGTIPSSRLGGTYSSALTLNNAGNAFSGSGAGLTALNAANLASGTLPDARLSGNVALLTGAQSFTGAKTFSAPPAFAAAGTPFAVNATGLVTNLNADLLDGLHSSAFLRSVPTPLTLSGTSSTHIIRGENSSGDQYSTGVIGVSTSATGDTVGVHGVASSPDGIGVYGESTSTSGQPYGLSGTTVSPNGIGVFARNAATSGSGGLGLWAISDTPGGYAIYAMSTAWQTGGFGIRSDCYSQSGIGVYGYTWSTTGSTTGVMGAGASTSATGVMGAVIAATGTTYGVRGESASASGRGVHGLATAVSGSTYGVWGESQSPDGRGVYGVNNTASGSTYGVHGLAASSSGRGVLGEATAASGSTRGVEGRVASTSGTALYGQASATTGFAYGVYGESASSSGRGLSGWGLASSGSTMGVEGFVNSAAGYGVYGANGPGSGYGVFASGRLGASGTKSFRIDHPEDPANRYLIHYSAESDEVINFYRGTAVLDERGEAVIELPTYFGRINTNPSYTLTPVGAPMPLLHVSREIDESTLAAAAAAQPGKPAPRCSFGIAGGIAGAKVSWRVEAVRNDAWMRRHGAPVETIKPESERGTYQEPGLYQNPGPQNQ
ncbi:MAG: hypothetical protein JSR77_10180 [Planctomycetes bacterium]|nr:hypothetical protein [Planctomycetota bacterium]